MEEKELFEDYEHKVWQWTPRLYKIFGAAIAIQFVIFAVIGQFNLLQTRACDTIIANKVCQVLDAAYIGSTFLNNKDWVDQEYTKNEFKDMDVTFIDVTNDEPPFTYPEGYFALVNPDELTTEPIPTTEDPLSNSGFSTTDPLSTPTPTSPSKNFPDLINTKPKLPKSNPNPVKGKVDDELFSVDDTPSKKPGSKPPTTTGTPRQGKPSKPNDGDIARVDDKGKPKGEPSPSPTPEVDLVTFTPNKKPLNDLRDSVKEKVAKNEVDLKAPFSITIDGYLDKEGKLDPKKTRFLDPQGDPKMVDLAKSAIEAINDSGLLMYLNKLGGKHLVATLQQDKDNITVVIKSAIETEEKAKSLTSGFKLLISTGKILRKGKDEEVLLNSATVSNQGKVFVLNFAVPQAVAQDLIQKQLKETTEEPKTQPNSGDAKNSNSKVGKL